MNFNYASVTMPCIDLKKKKAKKIKKEKRLHCPQEYREMPQGLSI